MKESTISFEEALEETKDHSATPKEVAYVNEVGVNLGDKGSNSRTVTWYVLIGYLWNSRGAHKLVRTPPLSPQKRN